MSNYTKTTNFAAKDALSSGDPNKIVKGTEIDAEFNNIATAVATKADTTTVTSVTTTANAALPKTGGAMTGAITTNSTFDGVDVGARDAVLTSTTTTANAALPKAGGTLTGNVNIDTASNPTVTIKNTDTTIVADQVIGTLEFRGADDSGNVLAGHIQQVASANWGIGDYGSDMVFSVKRAGTGGAFAEKLRLGYNGAEITGSTKITTAANSYQTALEFYTGSNNAFKITGHSDNLGYSAIGVRASGLQFFDAYGTRWVAPYNVDTGQVSDNLVDLGTSLARFDDIYATNGTIQTSDYNEKQDIEELTEAEARVAVACKGLLRKFRWKSAVAEKGDDARTHFGIIAQDLQAAFAAEGLDAGDYAMFISNTWEDEDGVEQTRLGVRYSELLAFIIGGAF